MKRPLMILVLICWGTIMSCTPIDETPEGVKVDFILMDSQGNERYEFQEGEDILFHLEIKNESRDTVWVRSLPFNEESFKVYRMPNNSFVGTPQKYIGRQVYFEENLINDPIAPSTSYSFILSWMGDLSLSKTPPRWTIFYQEESTPLGTGDYLVSFPMNIGFWKGGKFQKKLQRDFTVY